MSDLDTQLEISVNGTSRRVAAGTTVKALLTELGVATSRVAVERNREVVPRAQHGDTLLCTGDRLEVVAMVGGGV